MVKRLIKIAEKAKGIIFADPELLYKEERHLVNQPFFFEGVNGKAVLLVHGWTSTPYELRRLARYLNENGYTVLGIQLKGHGTVPMDLEGVKWQQWLLDVQEGFGDLKKTCEKVYIAGTSIGSNLAMEFAKRETGIAGLVLMATPYSLKFEKLVVLFAKLTRIFGEYHNKHYPPTFGLSTTITRLISYQSYPISSSLETFTLIESSRKDLKSIKQPCFVLQSTHDHIVSKNSLEKIYDGIGSRVKRRKYIKKAYHTFISDIRNDYVFKEILDFLNEN